MTVQTMSGSADPAAWRALGELSHRYTTGAILGLVLRQGTARAERIMFRIFRRQHLDLFLDGLRKLELDQLPDAVACAKYHVLSNSLGGVDVAWIPESDTKSWVRYRPPRWIFDGTAVCGVPTELSRAMLRGWHGHNGVSLGNPRLGFVCTMQTTDGQPGLEGYYVEEEHELDPDDRVRYRPGERPPGPPVELPHPTWPDDRLAKVERNYAVAYVRNLLIESVAELGPADARVVGSIAARQVAMQYSPAVMGMIDPAGTAPFAERMARLLAAQGDDVEIESNEDATLVRLKSWRLMSGHEPDPAIFDSWNGLWEGLASMEDLHLVVQERLDYGDPSFTWRILPVPGRRSSRAQ